MESVEQSGRMISEPTQSCESIRHQDEALAFEIGLLKFEYGPRPLELELTFEYGAELVRFALEFEGEVELVEFELAFPESPGTVGPDPDLRHAILKPSKNLPTTDSAGIILPYAVIVSIAHLFWTSDHHF